MMSPSSNDPGWAVLEGTAGALTMFTVFSFPPDYPRHYVVRRSFVLPIGEIVHDVVPRLAADLEDAREHIPPGLFCQPRMRGDEPHIVEAWF